jgi:hypothetical protein
LIAALCVQFAKAYLVNVLRETYDRPELGALRLPSAVRMIPRMAICSSPATVDPSRE